MSATINARKLEHIRVLENDPGADRQKFYFDAVQLRHRALPELDLAAVDSSVEFMGKRLSFPLLISSMTGGNNEALRCINANLAEAAERTGVAMGVGSQRVMFSDAGARESFAVRQYAPTALLFANIGAVQLNYGMTPDMCREAVEVAGADGLFLHLNPLQEAAQPEGDTDFSGLAEKIAGVVKAVGCPVIIKEVGAGISRPDAELLVASGVRYVDVAGSGGTSWSRVEQQRDTEGATQSVGEVFQDWGIPTPLALRELAECRDRLTLIASGGIRSGLDMAKAVVLGASLCGLARPFLEPAQESVDAVVAVIERLKRQFRTAMFLLGMQAVSTMQGNDDLLQTV